MYGPFEQESEEKNSKFRFFNMQNRTKIAREIFFKIFLITLLRILKEAS